MSATVHHSSAVLQQHIEAFNRRDVTAMVALYTADASWVDYAGQVLASGRAAIAECLRQQLRDPASHLHLVHRAELDGLVVEHVLVARSGDGGVQLKPEVAIHALQSNRIARVTYLSPPEPVPVQAASGAHRPAQKQRWWRWMSGEGQAAPAKLSGLGQQALGDMGVPQWGRTQRLLDAQRDLHARHWR